MDMYVSLPLPIHIGHYMVHFIISIIWFILLLALYGSSNNKVIKK